ncbi:MAG: DUF736 domain-containing protein [Pseudomonadota bacterium]
MGSFNIGRFRVLDNGDLIGSMATGTVLMKGVRFLKNRKTKPSQPEFRLVSQGGAELGAAWERASEKDGVIYLSGYFDAPELPNPVNFAVFEKATKGDFVMTWSRPKPKQDDDLDDMSSDFGSADQDDDGFPGQIDDQIDPFATEETSNGHS